MQSDPAPTRQAGTVRSIGGVPVRVSDEAGAVALVKQAIEAGGAAIFGFCNAHTVNVARGSERFREALSGMVLFNDGVGLDVAGRLLYGAPFPANLNGTDLTPRILEAFEEPTSVFLLGSPPGVAEVAAAAIEARHPNVRIAGCRDGFFREEEEALVAEQIRSSGVRLVLVAMGHPRQELWAARYGAATGAVLLCVGAFLDFAAGRVSRAPRFVRAMRMEWAYRLALEPKRLAQRYLIGNITFLAAVLRERRKNASAR